jgi:sulfite exporter TauE/SafE
MIYLTGFLLGVMGSLHCIGMCGPISLALPVPVTLNRDLAIGIYNAGRVLTYAVLGLAFGLLGHFVVMGGLQQFLSISCGLLILMMTFFPHSGSNRFARFTFSFSQKTRSHFGHLLHRHGLPSFLFLGMLNGLLPCGLVYVALAGATATGEAWTGGAYMGLFGAGTVPAMLALSHFQQLFALPYRSHFKKFVSGFVALTAVLLIIRGMNLGIPYISPELTATASSFNTKKCH